MGAENVPLPLFNRIATELPASFATARSGLPSPLKSPTATANGVAPSRAVGRRAPSRLALPPTTTKSVVQSLPGAAPPLPSSFTPPVSVIESSTVKR